MKKTFLAAALFLTALVTWSFYPKVAPDTQGYMMVTGRLGGTAFNVDASLVTITPDGQVTEQALTVKVSNVSAMMKAYVIVRNAELLKLNQLKAEGWEVVQATSVFNNALYENTYLLKKP